MEKKHSWLRIMANFPSYKNVLIAIEICIHCSVDALAWITGCREMSGKKTG